VLKALIWARDARIWRARARDGERPGATTSSWTTAHLSTTLISTG